MGIDGGRQAIQGVVDELGGPAEGIGLGGEAGDGVIRARGRVAEGVGASRKVAGGRSRILCMGNVVPDDDLFKSC